MTSKRHKPPGEAAQVTIEHDGEKITAYEGEPLAAALMAAGIRVLSRSAKYHRPRGTGCGSGECSRCMVTVDGLPNRCACMTPVRDGMVSRSQNVLGSARRDLLGVTDWMFPWGLDHHEMFTGVPLVHPVVQKVVRKLSGLGIRSDKWKIEGESHGSGTEGPSRVDLLVVGAGASGLAAAEAAAREGAEVVVVDARCSAGGRLSSGVHSEPDEAGLAEKRAKDAGARVWTEAVAVQIDREDHPLEVLVLRPAGLFRVRPRKLVLACGGYAASGIFENNDLPGVMAAEWAARLLSKWGVLVGERPLICADEPEAGALSDLFSEAGAAPVRVVPLAAAYAPVCDEPPATRLLAARGGKQVEKAVIETPDGRETVACDLIVVAAPPAPAFELALAGGAKVAYEPRSGGFAVLAGEHGQTEAADIFACGTLCGPCSVEEARESGEAAGRAAAAAARAGESPSSDALETRDAS